MVGSRQPDPAVGQERDDVGMTECGRPDECDLGVRLAFVRHAEPVGWREWYARTQLAIGADELVDEIYAPQAGCGEDGVDSSPARNQPLPRVRVVIRERGLEGRPIPPATPSTAAPKSAKTSTNAACRPARAGWALETRRLSGVCCGPPP